MGTPASGAISKRMPRVIPSRQPELSGGVKILPFFTTKMLAEVHSATSPRSLSITTSSKPSLLASATDQTLLSQEIVFTPASDFLAQQRLVRRQEIVFTPGNRFHACKRRSSVAAVPTESQTNNFTMLGKSRAVDEEIYLRAAFRALPEAHRIVNQVDARTAFRHFVGANHFVEVHADFRRRIQHGQMDECGVFLQAAPVALVSERFAARDAHGGEDAPAADKPCLAGRKPHLLDGQKALVMEDVRVNHSCASFWGRKKYSKRIWELQECSPVSRDR